MGTPKITQAKFDAVKQMLDFGTFSKADIASKRKISVSSVFFINKSKDYKEYRAFTSRQHKKDDKKTATEINYEYQPRMYKNLLTSKKWDELYVQYLKEEKEKDWDESYQLYHGYYHLIYTKDHSTDTLILTWVLIYSFALFQVLSFLI